MGLGDQEVQEVRVVRGVLVVLPSRGILGDLGLPSLPSVLVIPDVLEFRRLEAGRVSFGQRLLGMVDRVGLGVDCHNRLLYSLGHRLDYSRLHRGRQSALLRKERRVY